jgi:hypothetical protein
MRKSNGNIIALALGLVGIALVSLSSTPLAAQSDDKDMLVQDIGAYLSQCKPPASSPPTLSAPQCANQKAELLRRQAALHLSDADINMLLAKNTPITRGGPRPVWP